MFQSFISFKVATKNMIPVFGETKTLFYNKAGLLITRSINNWAFNI